MSRELTHINSSINSIHIDATTCINYDIFTNHLSSKIEESCECIWNLVSLLKQHTDYRELDVENLKAGFRYWHNLCLPHVGEFEDCWTYFQVAWAVYRCGVMKATIDAAVAMPSLLPDPKLGLLANVCRLLADQGNGSFYLSTRQAAALIGRGHAGSGAWALEQLKKLGLIRRTKIGVRPYASTWSYIGPAERLAEPVPVAMPPAAPMQDFDYDNPFE